MILENEILRIELDPKLPIVNRYLHKPTGQVFGGANADGQLQVNSCEIPWQEWQTAVKIEQNVVSYRMELEARQLAIHWQFALQEEELSISLVEVDDPEEGLESIGWTNLPLLVCDDLSYHYWRMSTGAPDPSAGHKMWATDAVGTMAELTTAEEPTPLIYGAIWNDRVCVFVDSNYPLFPITHQKTAGDAYAIALNTYRYRARNRILPLLKVTVGFLDDINGDQLANLSDYRLWINRSRPRATLSTTTLSNTRFLCTFHHRRPESPPTWKRVKKSSKRCFTLRMDYHRSFI